MTPRRIINIDLHLVVLFASAGLVMLPVLALVDASQRADELTSVKFTDDLIIKCAQSLDSRGYFIVKQMHSGSALGHLRQLATSLNGSRRDVYKSIFGDQKDLKRFAANHPRNVLGRLKMTFVGRTDLPVEFEDIYNNPKLLRFLRRVVVQTTTNPYPDLHLSMDKEGSLYVFTGVDGDGGEIHVDQHPFSCVHMLSKPEIGGELLIAHHPPKKTASGWDWNWDVLADIQSGSERYLERVVAEEGDMYCFKGNRSLHATGAIHGPKTRAILVAAYSPEKNFIHSEHVHALNNWGSKKSDTDVCQGNADCLGHHREL